VLRDSPLHENTAASTAGSLSIPGAPAVNVPVAVDGRRDWLLRHLGGQFNLVLFEPTGAAAAYTSSLPVPVTVWHVVPHAGTRSAGHPLVDVDGKLGSTYAAKPGDWLLFRPDQHLAARGRGCEPGALRASIARCLGHGVVA